MAVYAIDFDGTLADTKYPEIIGPRPKMVSLCKALKIMGHKLILWTSRDGEPLNDAIEWCKSQGLEFDSINAPLPEQIARWNNDTRKIWADYYIDDKALPVAAAEEMMDALADAIKDTV